MCHRSKSFSSNAIFMCFGLQRFCSLPRRFVRFHKTTIHCFELFSIANLRLCIRFHDARMLFVHPLTEYGWYHRSFQFSSCVLNNFWIFSVIGIDKRKFRSVFEHCQVLAFLLPTLVFLDSERLYQFSSILLAIHNLALSVSSRTHMYPFRGFSFGGLNFVNPLQESDTCLLESTFQ